MKKCGYSRRTARYFFLGTKLIKYTCPLEQTRDECAQLYVYSTLSRVQTSCWTILDRSFLHSIYLRDMLDIPSKSVTKLKARETITLHPCMCESRTRINYGTVNELVVAILLGTDYIDRFSVDTRGRKENRPLALPGGTDINDT